MEILNIVNPISLTLNNFYFGVNPFHPPGMNRKPAEVNNAIGRYFVYLLTTNLEMNHEKFYFLFFNGF